MEQIGKQMEDRWKGCFLIGGDLNARIGGLIREESEEKTNLKTR